MWHAQSWRQPSLSPQLAEWRLCVYVCYTELGWFFQSMCYVDEFVRVYVCVGGGLRWLGLTVCVQGRGGRAVVLRKLSGSRTCLLCLALSTPTCTAVYHTIQSCHRVNTNTHIHAHSHSHTHRKNKARGSATASATTPAFFTPENSFLSLSTDGKIVWNESQIIAQAPHSATNSPPLHLNRHFAFLFSGSSIACHMVSGGCYGLLK